MDESGIVLAHQGSYSLVSPDVPSGKVGSQSKENSKLRVTFTSFCSLSGDVHSPIFIVKNYSRSLKKPKFGSNFISSRREKPERPVHQT